MGDIGRNGEVQEIEVTSDDLAGTPISEVGSALPEGVLVALVDRDGDTRVPTADFVLERGDRITLIGDPESVREAVAVCHPG
jgi:Trk K+ transport system NAD-binding subunit